MLMGYSDDEDMIGLYRVEQLVWKTMKKALSDFASFDRPGVRKFQDSKHSVADLVLEVLTEARIFQVVMVAGIFQLIARQT